MSRLMSVSLTERAVVERRKTVTRRLGWRFIKPGDRLTLCRKVMGRRKGEPLVRLAEVEVVSVRREPLDEISLTDLILEGFPTLTPLGFVEFFIEHMGGENDQEVTRIEWRYLEQGARLIRASENLLDHWGTRTERGERITAEWGEPDALGIYEPVFTVHTDDVLALRERILALPVHKITPKPLEGRS